MLALIVLRSSDACDEDHDRVQSELQKFGWKLHPFRSGVLTADFRSGAPIEQVFATAQADMGISLSAAEPAQWSMEVFVVDRQTQAFHEPGPLKAKRRS